MAIFEKTNGLLIRKYDNELLEIMAWGEDSFRVRCTRNAAFQDEDWALIKQDCTAKVEIEINPDAGTAQITNGNLCAVLSNTGKLSFQNSRGEILLEEYTRTRYANDQEVLSLLQLQGREMKRILGTESYQIVQRFEAQKGEKLYGMGQYQQDMLNLKGASLELAQRNSQASVPFVLSNRGYGLLWNNPAVGKATFATNVTEWTAASACQIDYWITAGDSPAQIMAQYLTVTGMPPMMPEFAMGFWQCKLRYRTQQELLEVAREYKRRQVPLSVIVLDYFHWTNQGNWEFDPEYFPDPQAMVDELRQMGIELVVSVWPTVDKNSKNYEELRERGLLACTDRGIRTQMQCSGEETFLDVTNPEARSYLWNKLKENYGKYGIRSFWLDVAEPEYTMYDHELYSYHIGSVLQTGNIYPAMYAQALYEGLKKDGVEHPISLIRCAWAGSQRYGALVWSGDIPSTYESFRCQMAAGLNMAVAGIPWWTTDIGGFNRGDPKDPAFRELLVRWFQYGTFCPVMRLHGNRLPEMPGITDKVGGGMCGTGAPNEIWSFGDEVYQILKKYIGIREQMKPYVHRLMEQAHEEGKPPMRPMFYDFPEDPAAWDLSTQYMFGDRLLVAPVVYPGATEREVYLPMGSRWKNAETGELLEGGQSVICHAPMDVIPLFIRQD